MSRKQPKPNYDMLFQSAVYDLQMIYNEYKKNMEEYLKCTWYDDDGKFCILSGSGSIRDKIKNLEKRLIYANETVEKYRELRGDADVPESIT